MFKPGANAEPALPSRLRSAAAIAHPIAAFLRRRCLSLFLAALALGPSGAARALDAAPRTDANVVTAIDVSDSIGRHEEWLQQGGMVRALNDPRFIRAALAGPNGRIGFAVFTWSSGGRFEVLIPWTVIESRADAERIAAKLASTTLIDRSRHSGGDHDDAREIDSTAPDPDRLTDISAAIDQAALLLGSAPFATNRAVMNICANGVDNVTGDRDDGAQGARDRAVAAGATVNGLSVGREAQVAAYLRDNVIGGRDAFVMQLSDPDKAGDIMARKLQRDLIAWADMD